VRAHREEVAAAESRRQRLPEVLLEPHSFHRQLRTPIIISSRPLHAAFGSDRDEAVAPRWRLKSTSTTLESGRSHGGVAGIQVTPGWRSLRMLIQARMRPSRASGVRRLISRTRLPRVSVPTAAAATRQRVRNGGSSG
jgi:hypothetical protein